MSEPIVTTPLRERASNALRDRFLHEALDIATTKFIALRREAFGDFPQGEALRDRARAIKEATLQRLDAHLETLVANIERLGGHVHFATTAEEARRIIVDIARRTGARMAVKSKSMATEEIHLNDALEAIGVTPVETDLGEYIIQLAHERPSHIIAPAIHKTKGQVAELFSRELHRPGLARGARRVPSGPARQRPHRADRRPAARVALLPALRRVPQRLSRLSPDRRPRVRLHVPGPDRHPPHRDAQRPRVGEGSGARLVALRRLRGCLPGAHRHSEDADRAAAPGRRGAHRALARARRLQGLRAHSGSSRALSPRGPDRPHAPAPVRA